MEKKSELAGVGLRIHGHVSSGTIRIDRERSQADFLVMEKKTANTLPVTYQGIIPDTFKDGAEVVVEGTYQADRHHFQATVLMAGAPRTAWWPPSWSWWRPPSASSASS